jgi:perosamine synthetase
VDIARRHDLYVVEDAAVALGAYVGETHVGLIGDIGCFSFYPVKHITTGEGGMVITTRDDIAERVSKQRAFGIDKNIVADRRYGGDYDVAEAGLNYRLNEIGAAIGVVQMGRLPGFLEARASNYRALAEALAGVEQLEILELDSEDDLRAAHGCLVAVLRDDVDRSRKSVAEALKAEGIGTSVYYPKSLPDLHYYAERYGYTPGSCPAATRISERSIALPTAPHLAEGDIDRIATTVKEVLDS